jgi:hypothetical protein
MLTRLRHRFAAPQKRETVFRPVPPSRCEAEAGASASAIADTLKSTNVCIVRRALPQARCATIREQAERVMAQNDGGLHAHVFGRHREGDIFDIDVSIILHVLASPCLDAARAYFGVEPIVQMGNLLVRKLDPANPRFTSMGLPFHQDGFGYGAGTRLLNLWTLLSPDECGQTSPGLEFVLDQIGGIIPVEKNPRPSPHSHAEPSYDRMSEYLRAYDPWCPSVNLGDVIVFNEIAMHRSHLNRAQTLARYSAEVRIMPADATNIAFNVEHKWPYYTVSGRTMSGPRQIRSAGGQLESVTTGEWQIPATFLS